MKEFEVKTEVFNGPLELLLSLIEKRKLLINDISLAKVTDDYINHINDLENTSLKETSHFVLVASTLLLIKSKSLLPKIELTEEEEKSIEDLENRLRIYSRLKEVSLHVSEKFGQAISFSGGSQKIIEPIFTPTDQVAKNSLVDYIKSVINTFPKVEKLPEAIVKKVISLEETIGKLTDRIRDGLQMSFREFSGAGNKEMKREDKVNVIVSFLAMLELVKQGLIKVHQNSDYEDIKMETSEISTPNYS